MKYRQVKKQKKDLLATKASLKIEGQWVDGILLDKNGKVLPFPCEIKEGETYIVEVEK